MCLYDVNAEQLEGAKLAIQQQLEGLEGDGLLREGQTASQLSNSVSFSSDLQEAVNGADYIQVQVYELRLHQVHLVYLICNIIAPLGYPIRNRIAPLGYMICNIIAPFP